MIRMKLYATQEYYLHALSGPRPQAEEQEPDVEARRKGDRYSGLLNDYSMPGLHKLDALRHMPSTMCACSERPRADEKEIMWMMSCSR